MSLTEFGADVEVAVVLQTARQNSWFSWGCLEVREVLVMPPKAGIRLGLL
jgi:hypothetical protein